MNILFITHKVPYPPNKGEKIRAFNIIKYLSRHHRIFLYSLCDNKDDLKYKKQLKNYCHSVNLYRPNPFLSSLRAFIYLFTRYPLTLGYFFSYWMKKDIKEILKKEPIDAIFAFCSSSAQYALDAKTRAKKLIDFVDVDSDKWSNFSKASKFPLSLIYALESKRLKEWERKINKIYAASIVTTEKERGKLQIIDPSGKDKVNVVTNGIDFEYFKPQEKKSNLHSLIFTGQMDYLPNVDAVIYFYKEILPLIKKQIPDVVFYIVGRNPLIAIKKICKEAIITGFVEDIRDYLNKASVYVAPLRVCQGIQNKVLEAMAFGLPVVATTGVLEGIKALPEKEVLIGDTPEEFAQRVIELLLDEKRREALSKNAQEFVQKNHDWNKNLSQLDKYYLILLSVSFWKFIILLYKA